MHTEAREWQARVAERNEMEVAKALAKKGIVPPVFKSANLPGGDEFNKALEDKYGPLVKHLI